jgi:hypothetical protein
MLALLHASYNVCVCRGRLLLLNAGCKSSMGTTGMEGLALRFVWYSYASRRARNAPAVLPSARPHGHSSRSQRAWGFLSVSPRSPHDCPLRQVRLVSKAYSLLADWGGNGVLDKKLKDLPHLYRSARLITYIPAWSVSKGSEDHGRGQLKKDGDVAD